MQRKKLEIHVTELNTQRSLVGITHLCFFCSRNDSSCPRMKNFQLHHKIFSKSNYFQEVCVLERNALYQNHDFDIDKNQWFACEWSGPEAFISDRGTKAAGHARLQLARHAPCPSLFTTAF